MGRSEREVSIKGGGCWGHLDQVNEVYHQAEMMVCKEGQSRDRWEGESSAGQNTKAPSFPSDPWFPLTVICKHVTCALQNDGLSGSLNADVISPQMNVIFSSPSAIAGRILPRSTVGYFHFSPSRMPVPTLLAVDLIL